MASFIPIRGKCPVCGAPVRDTTKTSLEFVGAHHGEPWPEDKEKPRLHALECSKCDWDAVVTE